jgi:hypothetical protein
MSGGWRHDLENWDAVGSLECVDEQLLLMAADAMEVALDPRLILTCHNQGPVGSCRGHSGSTIAEWIQVLITGEVPAVERSRAMMYYETQRIDGIRGDRGSTIMGGVKLLRDIGLCRESLWNYRPTYSPQRPSNWNEILKDAESGRVVRSVRLQSYDAVRAFLGTGQGGVDCGIMWSSAYARPVVERYNGGGGGHAIALPVLSERKDSHGRPYVWMFNSHGMQSGVNGWSEWSPSFVDAAIRSRGNVFVGLSDMPNLKPREISLDEIKKKLRV